MRLGPYRVFEQLGPRSLAPAFKARARTRGRPWRSGECPGSRLPNLNTSPFFQHEARAIAHLQYPHILSILNFGITDGETYIVMLYLDRGALAGLLYEMAPGRLTYGGAGPGTLTEVIRVLAEPCSFPARAAPASPSRSRLCF
jgi:hypothetical protein